MDHKKKNYIIVKDRHPYVSEVLWDCRTDLCVPARKNEPLSSILQKLCNKISSNFGQLSDMIADIDTDTQYFLEAGDNVTVSGDGSQDNPWTVSAEASSVAIEEGNGINITGLGTEVSPWIISQQETMDIFLIAGQSNMVGQGNSATSPNPSSNTVYQYHSSTFSQVTNEVGAANTGSAWPSFGIKYYELTGRKICFVTSAVNGSAQTTQADTGNGNWSTSGTLYSTSVTNVTNAISAVTAAGYTPVFKGVLWGQGENDARAINDALVTALQYTTALTTMVTNYRTQFGANMPFYIFQTGTEPAEDPGTGYLQIRNAQQAFADSEPLLNIMAFRNALTFADRSLLSDGLHYNQTGLNEMGEQGAINVASHETKGFEPVGTIGVNFPGYVGIKAGTPSFPLDILNNSIGKQIFLDGTVVNDAVRLETRNQSNTGLAGSGMWMYNNVGLQAQLVVLSTASIVESNATLLNATNNLILNSSTGFLNLCTAGPTSLFTKLRITPAGNAAFGENATPVASAQLEIRSPGPTNPPRGTLITNGPEARRDLISSPATGLLWFNTDTLTLDFFNGSVWGPVDTTGGGSSAVSDTFNATSDWTGPSGGYYSFAFNHALASDDILVTVWDETSTPVQVLPEIVERTDNNTVTIRVPDSPDSRFAGRVVVI